MPPTLSEAQIREFRRRACETAEQLFAEGGTEAVTMRRLGSTLGISHMTVYRYFRGKEEILTAMRAQAFNRFADRLEAAQASGGDLEAKSQRVAEAYADFALSDSAGYRLMFEVDQTEPDPGGELAAAAGRAHATLTRQVEDFRAARVVEGDAQLIGHIYWSVLHGALMLQMAGRLGPGVDPARLRAEAVAAITRGFAPAA